MDQAIDTACLSQNSQLDQHSTKNCELVTDQGHDDELAEHADGGADGALETLAQERPVQRTAEVDEDYRHQHDDTDHEHVVNQLLPACHCHLQRLRLPRLLFTCDNRTMS